MARRDAARGAAAAQPGPLPDVLELRSGGDGELAVGGWSENNADRIEHEQHPLSWLGYVGSADFWQTTLQNWQSEFLAVGSMAVLAIYLRQRGSPESKPVGCPHDATGADGQVRG